MPIKRVFLDWKTPALPAAADWLFRHHARSPAPDLTKLLLVFPGRRALRRMRELLVQRATVEFPAWLPPQMMTFQSFPEVLYPARRKLADDLTQLLVWRQALFAVPESDLQPAVPQRPDPGSVSAWATLCESLRRLHTELAGDGCDFADVVTHLTARGQTVEASRWQALRAIQVEYLRQLDALSLWDGQTARLVAVEQRECRTELSIVLVGTTDMNRIIRRMLEQVSDRVTALIHAPESEAGMFDEFGCVRPEAWASRKLNIPLDISRIANSPAGQAQAVIEELVRLDGQFRADDIAIGVTSDDFVAPLMQSLAAASLSGRAPVGRTLAASRPFRMLQALASHLNSARNDQPPDFATLSEVVRHPDVYDWISRRIPARTSREWLAELDDYLAEHLQTAPGRMLGESPRRETITAVCTAVNELLHRLLPEDPREPPPRPRSAARKGPRQKTLVEQEELQQASLTRKLAAARPLSDWADGVLRVLTELYAVPPSNHDPANDTATAACVSALQELAALLRRLNPAIIPACGAGPAVQFLLRQVSGTSLAADQNPESIELLGWLELPLDDSPVLLLTGLNEGLVPQALNADAFLPNRLRSEMNLTDNSRRYARDACALLANCHSRRHLRVFATRFDDDNNPVPPSRLWLAADPSTLSSRIRLFYAPETEVRPPDEAETVTVSSQEPQAISIVAGQDRSGFVVTAPDTVRRPPQELAVTAFGDYLRSPYRWYLNRVLRLSEVSDDVREIPALTFGNLAHAVLLAFGSSDKKDSRSAKTIDWFLREQLRTEVLKTFGRDRSATVDVQIAMLESRLSRFAEWQAATREEGWQIVHAEQDLRAEEFVDSRGRAVVLTGRIDRIDRHETSRQFRVLDYKTGDAPVPPEKAHRSKGEWISLQLPLYRQLVRSLGITGDVELGFVLLPGDIRHVGWVAAEWTEEELHEADRLAAHTATRMIDMQIPGLDPEAGDAESAISRICQDTVIDRRTDWAKS
jgi:hypothetical protein